MKKRSSAIKTKHEQFKLNNKSKTSEGTAEEELIKTLVQKNLEYFKELSKKIETELEGVEQNGIKQINSILKNSKKIQKKGGKDLTIYTLDETALSMNAPENDVSNYSTCINKTPNFNIDNNFNGSTNVIIPRIYCTQHKVMCLE